MKAKTLLFRSTLLLLIIAATFTSCKKQKAFNDEDGQASSDSRNVQGENDAAINDVNDVIGKQASLAGRSSGTNGTTGITGSACDATVDTSNIKNGMIQLNYDGSTTCFNRKRTGSIKITVQNYTTGKRWKQQGCVLKLEYINYKILRPSDGKSIMLNGSQLLTNVSGGSWWELIILKSLSSLIVTVTGTNLSATFDDGKTATYNINRRFTYTYPQNVITCVGEGIGSLNGINNLENYGLTRDGDEFTSQMTTPLLWNLTCGPWAPLAGEVNIKVDNKEFELKCLFGVDNGGNSVAVSANNCPYGWKVEWKYKKKTNNKVIAYQ
jgi:hypothetical protein